MPDSDSLYHRLFSIPCMVEMLVREFVPLGPAAGLDFSRLQRVNTKFHPGRSAHRRESDVIWRVPTREGADLYLYLLLEFQSRVDWWMAVRAQIYQGLLWQQIIDEQKLKPGARLPPLLLLVLHNGMRRWNAPTQVRKLIALSRGSALWSWQPQVRYHLLDMGAFPGDELTRRRSLAALLFRLERPLTPDELQGLRGEVSSWFSRHPDQERLRQLFAELVSHAFQDLELKVPASDDLLETKMKTNLATIGQRWKQEAMAQGRAEGRIAGHAEGRAEGRVVGRAEGRAEGRAQGMARGRAEGRIEGKAEALICVLVARFGALTPSLRTRIHRAKLATLDRWLKRVLVAPDLPSVFGRSRRENQTR